MRFARPIAVARFAFDRNKCPGTWFSPCRLTAENSKRFMLCSFPIAQQGGNESRYRWFSRAAMFPSDSGASSDQRMRREWDCMLQPNASEGFSHLPEFVHSPRRGLRNNVTAHITIAEIVRGEYGKAPHRTQKSAPLYALHHARAAGRAGR